MKQPSFPWIAGCCAGLGFWLVGCDDQRARQRGIGTLEERSPSGAHGTTGTGADEPAPPEVREQPAQ